MMQAWADYLDGLRTGARSGADEGSGMARECGVTAFSEGNPMGLVIQEELEQWTGY